jgi:hypothetical protein
MLRGRQAEAGRCAGDENSHTFRIESIDNREEIAMSTTTVVLLAEYLATSYRPDCEYLDGELLERNVGEWEHSRLHGLLFRYLSNREKQWGILVVPEQRVQVKARRLRVPDIACSLARPLPDLSSKSRLFCA